MTFKTGEKTWRTVCIIGMVFNLLIGSAGWLLAADWPQWRGENRRGVWDETGMVENLPSDQIPALWRADISGGYSGPTVMEGKVYVMDRREEPNEIERVLCFDAQTGQSVWTFSYDCSYAGVDYKTGPRSSVTLDNQHAYALGTMGHLHCFDADKGTVVWKKDLNTDYKIQMPVWGIAASPILVENLLIVQIGGQDNAALVAFDKTTGKEIWRALADKIAYSSPILITQAGQPVLVAWTEQRVVGLNPFTGEVHWHLPFGSDIGIATPIETNGYLFVSSFFHGACLIKLDEAKLSAKIVWQRKGNNENKTDALHCLISTPYIEGNYIYGVDSYGQVRCLDLLSGDRLWEDLTAVPKARWATIHMVRHGEKTWMFNDQGELLIAKLSPQGLTVLSRAQLIEPTRGQLNRKDGVCWSHPAYANQHIYIRNDKELICASLAKSD